MNDQELKREVNRLQVMTIAFSGGMTMLVGAMLLLLLEVIRSESITVQSPGAVLAAVTFGVLLVTLGMLTPSFALAWDWWHDRKPAEGGAA